MRLKISLNNKTIHITQASARFAFRLLTNKVSMKIPLFLLLLFFYQFSELFDFFIA